jgi:hypothetical protein
MEVEEQMTDDRPRPPRGTYTKYSTRADEVPRAEPRPLPRAEQSPSPRPVPQRPQAKRSMTAGRIAAAGIGLAAMVGLVANMEIAGTKAEAAKAAAAKIPATTRSTAGGVKNGTSPVRYAAAKVKKKPIVLTPHTVVHTVSAPAPSGGGGGGYAYTAPAAPVASSGGS